MMFGRPTGIILLAAALLAAGLVGIAAFWVTWLAHFVNGSGRKDTTRVTGAGGSVEVDSITLTELALRINGFNAVLRPAQVLLQGTTFDSRWLHIWIGLDLLNQARVVTIHFKSMMLALE